MASNVEYGDNSSNPKSRRNSARRRRPSSSKMLLSPSSDSETFEASRKRFRDPHEHNHNHSHEQEHDHDHDHYEEDIAISSSVKTVTPFLAQHIPQTYNPLADSPTNPMENGPSANTKYCNRHRPDRKCRRQANEVSMEELQTELGGLSQSDQQGISHVWSVFSAAPAKQRELILQGILSVCCFPQLSFISAQVRDLIKIDFLSLLPPELGFKILCSLDTLSLCSAARVSRRWRQLADDDVVWHKMCEQHIDRKCTKCGWGLPLLERKRLRMEKRQIQLRASGRGLNEWSPDITPLPESLPGSRQSSVEPATSSKRPLDTGLPSPEASNKRLCIEPSKHDQKALNKKPWKEVYKARFKVGINWKYGRPSSVKVLKGHTNGVVCLQFRDNILATGSYDTTIKIWDIESGTEVRQLTGHTSGVRCLQFDDKQLASGSLDCTVKIWDWTTGELKKELRGPTKGVISVHFDGNYLCAGSMDTHIYVWNTLTKRTERFSGHTDFVNSVRVDSASRTVLSASDDCTVRLWDLDSGALIRVFEGHVGPVQQVLPLPHEFEMDESDLADSASQDQDTDTDHDYDDHEEDNIHYARAHTHGRPRTDPRAATPPPSLVNTPMFPNDPSRPNPPQYILTGALDSTIRLWHVPSNRCLKTFFGHLEGIWALAADSLRVVSGAEDRMVKVWDPRTGKCEKTFGGHQGPVTCVGLSGERLISGGEDADIRILEFGEAGLGAGEG